MKLNEIKSIVGTAAESIANIGKGIKCVDNSHDYSMSLCQYKLYDIIALSDEVKAAISEEQDAFWINEILSMNCNEIANVSVEGANIDMSELELIKSGCGSDIDANKIAITISVHPTFFKWQIKQLFNVDINPIITQQIQSVMIPYFKFLLGDYVQKAELSVGGFGEVIIIAQHIVFK